MTDERRPLVMTTDADLLDDVLGAAAAVGLAVDVTIEPGNCGPQWIRAPLVLVGSDLAPALAGSALRPRPGVLIVSRGGAAEKERIGAALDRAEDVVCLPAGEPLLLERLADVAEPPDSGRIVAILPGRGGAGASVLATAIALTAGAQGDAAWLVDLDPLGGGADAGLGAELVSGARWDDLGSIAGRLSSRALRAALPEVDGVAVLSCGRTDADPPPAAVRAVLAAARRSGGTVVVDLPRHPTAATVETLSAADELLLVVPAEVRAVLAARQLVSRLGLASAPLRIVVRRVPAGLPPHEVARGLDADLLGDYGDEPAVRVALLNGEASSLIRHTDLGALCSLVLNGSVSWAEAS